MNTEHSPFLRTKALLFDRLDESSDSTSTAQTGYIGIEELKRSIIEQLDHLLNTRRAPIDKPSLTVLDYGIPDYSAFSVGDTGQMRRLIRCIEQAIVAFEPRLKNVRAELLKADPTSLDQSLQIRLSAQLSVEPLTDDIKLYLILSSKYGRVSIHERDPS